MQRRQPQSNVQHQRKADPEDGPFDLLALHWIGDTPIAIDLREERDNNVANEHQSIERARPGLCIEGRISRWKDRERKLHEI